MTIEERAAQIAAEVQAETEWLAPCFGLDPAKGADPMPYAMKRATFEAELTAKFNAAPEALRNELAQIDRDIRDSVVNRPKSHIDYAGYIKSLYRTEALENKRSRIIKQIYGV